MDPLESQYSLLEFRPLLSPIKPRQVGSLRMDPIAKIVVSALLEAKPNEVTGKINLQWPAVALQAVKAV